jgi:hypothetical protein
VTDKFPYQPSIWDDYLPIHPTPPSIPGGVQLQLGDLDLRKPSYVKIKGQYTVHTSMLERYDRRCAESRFCLDTESFGIVLESVGTTPTRRRSGAYATPDLRGNQQAHSRQERISNLRSAQRRHTTPQDLGRTHTLYRQPAVPHSNTEEPRDEPPSVTGRVITIACALVFWYWLARRVDNLGV